MANQLQESLLKAIDILVNNKIDNMQTDKTVVATIVTCTNALTGEYKVSYNGGFMTAYAQENVTYTDNASVYILIPQNDFTKKKMIISKSQALENDKNISFVSSALSNYNVIGKNTITDKEKLLPLGIHSYLKSNYHLIYQYGQTSDKDHQFIQIDIDELTNNIKEAEALMIEASFYTRLPKLHRLSDKGVYGVQFVLAFNDADKTDENGKPIVKYLSYTLDNNNMTGNPFLYTTWSDQYAIYPIDIKNFLYIDSIMFFGGHFVEKDDTVNKELYGEDIFIKDLEVYGLKKITAINGDYKLSLSSPQGTTFKSIQSKDSLQMIGKVTQKDNTNLSDATMFYWFVEDGRVTSSSADYQMYGGAGWKRLKDKGSNYTLTLYGNENKAYENKYLCVAVYKETVILKEYFTIYNEAAKRDISISSNLGVKFSFDRGAPTLTCLIDGKEKDFELNKPNAHSDKLFRFVWSKVNTYGNTTIFNQTLEQLKIAYEQGIKDNIGYSALAALKNQMAEMEGVEFVLGANKFTYPIKQIDSSAIFKCSVYLKDNEASEEYYIGTADITLQNEASASPTDYYILIENGDQVFQYSESGVSPDSERYADPLEIKPLTCHFYDPAGLEVNEKTYEIKWLVPLSDSMLNIPKEGMVINPSTEKIEYCTSEIYPTSIKSNYDYQALNNQIKAIVKYQEQEYSEETTFLFTKVGENGTNGTDIVAKIYPTSKNNILEKELLTLELVDNIPKKWNTGQTPSEKVLSFNLYQRNENLNVLDSKVTWSVAGGNSAGKSKYLSISDGKITWSSTDAGKRIFRNQIARAYTSLEGQNYYAFYPIAVIDYKSNVYGEGKKYHISIDNQKTLKTITYNSDGRNPLYNKNQGIFIKIDDLVTKSLTDKYIVWFAEGGTVDQYGNIYEENPDNAAIQLIYEKDSKNGKKLLTPRIDTENNAYELLDHIYILPNDVYDGAYCNNLVHCKIYNNKTIYDNKGNPETEFYVPIHLSLNTFGLASLNAWDGNHIEINEDENYILAPQIGAGVKDDENKFTGIVMGKAQTYDQKDPTVGLLGYSHGKQSIFLDSETGKAIFGLPEDQASTQNQFTEGRIEFVPGGDSKIGMWNIGSRALYNMSKPNAIGNSFIGVSPGSPYRDYPVQNSQMSIPPEAQGMLLNANPAYLSVKGMPLDETNSNIDWGGANTTIKQGDSLEVELDPRKSSVFSIYRHTTWTGNINTKQWRRYPLVGINQNGQFYTNAVEDGESSMGIGVVGAFHDGAANNKYVGAQFGWKESNLFKFYVDTDDVNSDQTKKLFISTGSIVDKYDKNGNFVSKGNEYPRDLGVYAKSISLYAPDQNKENEPISTHKIEISQENAFIGHEKSYFSIPLNKAAELKLENNLNILTSTNRDIGIFTGNLSISTNSNFTISSEGKSVFTIKGNKTETIGGEAQYNSKMFKLQMLSSQMTLGDNGNTTYLQFNPSAVSLINADKGWNIKSKTGGIILESTNSADGIVLQATPVDGNKASGVRFSMIPQSGGASDFILTSPNGTIRSKSNLGNNRNGIELTPGISTSWGVFSGVINGTNDSIQTSKNIYCGNDINSGHDIIAKRDIKALDGWAYANWFSVIGREGIRWSDGYNWNESDFKNAWNRSLDWSNTKNNFDNRISNAQRSADNAQYSANAAQYSANSANDYASRLDYSKAGNDVWGHVHKANNNLANVKSICGGWTGNDPVQLARVIASVIYN